MQNPSIDFKNITLMTNPNKDQTKKESNFNFNYFNAKF